MKRVKISFKGAPGWHIECSAMASKYLGKQFDIHTGGTDHIPVHHTNEIAQAEAALDVHPWVKYWLHGEFLVIDKGKMAKSGESFLTLAALEERGYDPLDYRYFCLTAHYRQQLKFSWEGMETAQTSRTRLMNILEDLQGEEAKDHEEKVQQHEKEFLDAINDDLNMPQALAVLWNVLRDENMGKREKKALLHSFDTVFGLNLFEKKKESIPQEIMTLAEEREKARKAKEWKKSDELRKKINEKGYQINDQKEGYRIKKN